MYLYTYKQYTHVDSEVVTFCQEVDLQSLAGSINESLTQALVLRDGLQYGALLGDIANGPLAQSGTTQSEYVPEHTMTMYMYCSGRGSMHVCGWRKGPDHTIDHNNYVYYGRYMPYCSEHCQNVLHTQVR